ncbi:hypothetical protein BCAR13_890045 [Paraburkholderia caribensis]|nr:hypothetical protein BCAR13_890045 [Paraburkholderia caribensis]
MPSPGAFWLDGLIDSTIERYRLQSWLTFIGTELR